MTTDVAPTLGEDGSVTPATSPAGPDSDTGPSAATTTRPKATKRVAHMPALDGMRGLFVIIGPLAYHFAPYWIPGGILGIDLFFVLSSFLIVTILLNEHERTDAIDVGSYASRRVRRLLPALIATFVVCSFVTAFILDASKVPKWTGGITAAMSYVANWREIFAGTNYFDSSQYSNPQPFRHVWSFAIEEQFYLFAPFFIIICLKWLSKRWLAILSIGGAIASAIWMAVIYDAKDPTTLSRAYYGTDTRAFALLLGIAMAVICHDYGPPRTKVGHWLTQFMGLISTVVFLYLMLTVSEKTSWMFEYGGFFLVAVLSVFMTRAVAMPSGWLHWVYQNRFLMWAGRLGFGLYLYHWLVFIAVDSNTAPDKPGFNSARDMILGFGLTFLLAWASYRWIEKPFIKGRWPGWKLTAGLAGGIIVSLALLLYANTVSTSKTTSIANAVPGGGTLNISMGQGKQCVTPPGSNPVRVLVVGDSVMAQLTAALRDWCADNPGQIEVLSEAHIGCGTTRGGEKRYEEGTGSMGDVCATWADPVDPAIVADPEVVSWVTAVDLYKPDVVLGMGSAWDTIDRKVPQLGDVWYQPGDPPYDAYITSEYQQALHILSSTGATIAWMVSPHLDRQSAFNTPDRITRLNQIVLPMVQALPRQVIIDYQTYLGPTGGPQDKDTRVDGVHLRPDRLRTVADWLAPQLVAANSVTSTNDTTAPN